MIDTDKSGILVTDENNNIKNKFNSGEKFKVLIPKNIVTTNFSIGVNAYLSCETKPILYGESYDPNYQDYVVTTDPYEDVSTNTTLAVKKLQEDGKLIIYKIDSQTKEPIKGVSFELYSHELNKVIGTYTTNSEGELLIENLRTGDYTLNEISTDKWYNLAEDVEVKIKYNETTEVAVYNELKKGQIKVVKIDADENNIPIEGVKFNIMTEDGEILETITTDKNGEATSDRIPIRYQNVYVQEIETDKNHVLNDEIIKFELKENQIVTETIENESKKGEIQVIKKDFDNHKILLDGVVFGVLDEERKIKNNKSRQ